MDNTAFWQPHFGAVSLTFDDAPTRASQLEFAVPAMERHGIRGTFFMCPTGDDWREKAAPWKPVAARGHEIGNHTLSHTCSANFGFSRDRRGLEDMTLDQIEADILAAQERLVEVFPQQKTWTFCYPCYQAYVGRGAARQSYVPVVARHFIAGRGRGEYGYANNPATVDLAYTWGFDAARLRGFEMIGLAETLTAKGQWVVFTFHDTGGGRLSASTYDFALLLAYLERKRRSIWTAPFGAVAQKVAEYQRR